MCQRHQTHRNLLEMHHSGGLYKEGTVFRVPVGSLEKQVVVALEDQDLTALGWPSEGLLFIVFSCLRITF